MLSDTICEVNRIFPLGNYNVRELFQWYIHGWNIELIKVKAITPTTLLSLIYNRGHFLLPEWRTTLTNAVTERWRRVSEKYERGFSKTAR